MISVVLRKLTQRSMESAPSPRVCPIKRGARSPERALHRAEPAAIGGDHLERVAQAVRFARLHIQREGAIVELVLKWHSKRQRVAGRRRRRRHRRGSSMGSASTTRGRGKGMGKECDGYTAEVDGFEEAHRPQCPATRCEAEDGSAHLGIVRLLGHLARADEGGHV